MTNNVVYAVSGALTKRGIAALYFNFRGVGRSEGVHDGGQGEIDDALAAIAFLAGRSEIDAGRIGLAGYSFGGAVALNAAMQSGRIRAVAAVSPPEMPDLGGFTRPRLILCGSEDSLVPASFLLQQKERITGPDGAGAVEVISGADHFWYGYEEVLAARLPDGSLFGAGLDVYSKEPLPEDSILWDAPNLIMSPHCAPASPLTRDREFEITYDNIGRFIEGQPLRNVCDKVAAF